MKTLSSFPFKEKVYPTRINDISQLNMHPNLSNKLLKEVKENRMHYELYIESAESFNELKDSLKKRGYTNLPIQQFTGYVEPTTINKSALVTENSTMIRRGSS